MGDSPTLCAPIGGHQQIDAQIPPSPLCERGASHDTMSGPNKSSSPFVKGERGLPAIASRSGEAGGGILLNVHLAKSPCSTLIVRAKLNYTTSKAGGFWKVLSSVKPGLRFKY